MTLFLLLMRGTDDRIGIARRQSTRAGFPNGTMTMYRTLLVEHRDRVAVITLDRPEQLNACLLYTSPSPRDRTRSRMPSSA